MTNVKLLQDIKSAVAKQRERHNQGAWRQLKEPTADEEYCGTALCTAGWAAELSGAEWFLSVKDLVVLFDKEKTIAERDAAEDDFDPDPYYVYNPEDFEPSFIDYVLAVDEDPDQDVCILTHPITGKRVNAIAAEKRAQRILGLSEADKDRLFYCGNGEWDNVIDEFIEVGEAELAAANQ